MTKLLFIIAIVYFSFQSTAQYADALLWTSASLEGKFNKDFNFELNTQFRFDDNMSRLSAAFVQPSIDYELGKLFKIALGYRLSNSRGNDNYSLKNRLFSDLNFDYEIVDDLDIELRLRAQYDFDRLKSINEYILPNTRTLVRIRYGFEYKIKDWKPSISNEYFFNIADRSFSRFRINLGLGYKVSKRHHVKLEYTFQQKQTNIIVNDHIYQIGYSYSIKGKLLD